MQDSLIIDTIITASQKDIVLGSQAEICNTLHSGSSVLVESYTFNEVLNSVLILFVIAFISATIYRHKLIVRSILHFPFSKFSEGNLRDSSDMNVMKVLQRFTFIYFLSLLLGLFKIGEISFFNEKTNLLSKYGVAIFLCCVVLYYVYFYILNKVLEWYNAQNSFFKELWFEKNLICSFLGIITAPCIILSVFASQNILFYTKYVCIFVILISILYYFIKIYCFFKIKNVSFLQYILYFCIVDFVPVSLFYAIINKYLNV